MMPLSSKMPETLQDSFMRVVRQIHLARPDARIVRPNGKASYRGMARLLGYTEYSEGTAFRQLLVGESILLHSVLNLSARLNNAGFSNIPVLLSLDGCPLTGELSTRCETPLLGDVIAPEAFDYFAGEYVRDVVRTRRLTPGAYMSQAQAGKLVGAPNIVYVIENANGKPHIDKFERLLELFGMSWQYFAEPRLVATA